MSKVELLTLAYIAFVPETSAELFMAAGGAVASWQEGRRDRGED